MSRFRQRTAADLTPAQFEAYVARCDSEPQLKQILTEAGLWKRGVSNRDRVEYLLQVLATTAVEEQILRAMSVRNELRGEMRKAQDADTAEAALAASHQREQLALERATSAERTAEALRSKLQSVTAAPAMATYAETTGR